MIVADTNLILYLLLDTDRTQEAEAALARDSAWCAPALWESECRNALVLYIRKELVGVQGALHVLSAGRRLLAQRVMAVKSEDVIRCALAYGISGYDAECVALAERLGAPLVTDDQRVLQACPHVAVAIAAFVGG